MASAVLSPGAPSSFPVRALTSWGEGKRLSRELKAVSFTLTGRGRERGVFEARRSFLGLEEGRERAANRAGRGKKRLRARAATVPVLTAARPRNRGCVGRRRSRPGLSFKRTIGFALFNLGVSFNRRKRMSSRKLQSPDNQLSAATDAHKSDCPRACLQFHKLSEGRISS
nr:recQ-mediated genome instability protein 1 isoform X2 [Equus caballus]